MSKKFEDFSIRPIPKSGLEVDMRAFDEVRLESGEKSLWNDKDNRDNLLFDKDGTLGRLLARFVEHRAEEKTAYFEFKDNGREFASKSVPIDPLKGIPQHLKEELEQGYLELQEKAKDPKATDEAKEFIRSLRLADPKSSPDMYRIFKDGNNERLLVLWGCNRRGSTPLLPLDAIQMLRSYQRTNTFQRALIALGAALIGLVLLLLLLGMFAPNWFIPSDDNAIAAGTSPAIGGSQSVQDGNSGKIGGDRGGGGPSYSGGGPSNPGGGPTGAGPSNSGGGPSNSGGGPSNAGGGSSDVGGGSPNKSEGRSGIGGQPSSGGDSSSNGSGNSDRTSADTPDVGGDRAIVGGKPTSDAEDVSSVGGNQSIDDGMLRAADRERILIEQELKLRELELQRREKELDDEKKRREILQMEEQRRKEQEEAQKNRLVQPPFVSLSTKVLVLGEQISIESKVEGTLRIDGHDELGAIDSTFLVPGKAAVRKLREGFRTLQFAPEDTRYGGKAETYTVVVYRLPKIEKRDVKLSLDGNLDLRNLKADWGDGSPIELLVGKDAFTHTYAKAGKYTIRIIPPQELSWAGKQFDVSIE